MLSAVFLSESGPYIEGPYALVCNPNPVVGVDKERTPFDPSREGIVFLVPALPMSLMGLAGGFDNGPCFFHLYQQQRTSEPLVLVEEDGMYVDSDGKEYLTTGGHPLKANYTVVRPEDLLHPRYSSLLWRYLKPYLRA